MKDCSAFYEERDQRTTEYAGSILFNSFPVHISIDPECSSEAAGQLALLALINQVARVHRRITVSLAEIEIPLLTNAVVPSSSLQGCVEDSARAIDPCGQFSFTNERPHDAITIGIGHPDQKCDWYIGAEGSVALLDRSPCPFDFTRVASLRGAALASCLGAAAVFKRQIGLRVVPARVSAWNYAEGEAASQGPDDVLAVDVGRVLMVGAGAVASGLVYWLRSFGLGDGEWLILDKDVVALHNTNRSLLFMPADAGWPDGTPKAKADICAAFLPNSRAIQNWYHEVNLEGGFDVILALANEYDVRTRLANRPASVLLHATTGEGWLSELHRHISGRDDCIQCRTRDFRIPRLGCSTSPVKDQQARRTSDAALPFLSAASGLMLATAMERLQRRELHDGEYNNWKLYFNSEYRMTQATVNECRDGCSNGLPPELRRALNSGRRWSDLDPG
jgi:hypothetical protein